MALPGDGRQRGRQLDGCEGFRLQGPDQGEGGEDRYYLGGRHDHRHFVLVADGQGGGDREHEHPDGKGERPPASSRCLFCIDAQLARRDRCHGRLAQELGAIDTGVEDQIDLLTRFRLFRFGQTIRNDLYHSTDGHLRIKLGDIPRFHPDAAVTCGATDLFFFRCAVNVNATLKRVRVLRLEAAQPDDARSNGVAARSVGLKNFTR